MTPKELLAQKALQKEQIAALQELWIGLFPEFPDPGIRQYQVWLNMPYDFPTVVYGLEKAMQFLNRRIQEGDKARMPVSQDDIIRFASGCMKKHKAESCETA